MCSAPRCWGRSTPPNNGLYMHTHFLCSPLSISVLLDLLFTCSVSLALLLCFVRGVAVLHLSVTLILVFTCIHSLRLCLSVSFTPRRCSLRVPGVNRHLRRGRLRGCGRCLRAGRHLHHGLRPAVRHLPCNATLMAIPLSLQRAYFRVSPLPLTVLNGRRAAKRFGWVYNKL